MLFLHGFYLDYKWQWEVRLGEQSQGKARWQKQLHFHLGLPFKRGWVAEAWSRKLSAFQSCAYKSHEVRTVHQDRTKEKRRKWCNSQFSMLTYSQFGKRLGWGTCALAQKWRNDNVVYIENDQAVYTMRRSNRVNSHTHFRGKGMCFTDVDRHSDWLASLWLTGEKGMPSFLHRQLFVLSWIPALWMAVALQRFELALSWWERECWVCGGKT